MYDPSDHGLQRRRPGDGKQLVVRLLQLGGSSRGFACLRFGTALLELEVLQQR